MWVMYVIFRREDTGKLVEVAKVEDQAAADRYVKRMKSMWSAEYVVKETEPKTSDRSG